MLEEFGPASAADIVEVLANLRAAPTLSDLPELSGYNVVMATETLVVDTKPARLIFELGGSTKATNRQSGTEWVTRLKLREIVVDHDRGEG